VLIATLGAQLLNDALKLAFHRPRPSGFVSVIPVKRSASRPARDGFDCLLRAMAVIGWRVLAHELALLADDDDCRGFPGGVSRLFLGCALPHGHTGELAGGLFWLDVTLCWCGSWQPGALPPCRRVRTNPIRSPPCKRPDGRLLLVVAG